MDYLGKSGIIIGVLIRRRQEIKETVGGVKAEARQ